MTDMVPLEAPIRIVAARAPLDSLCILIVDDNEDARTVLRAVLEAEGAKVVAASSGAAALSLVAEAQPDAMLVDLAMPVVDGFTLVEQLRLRPAEQGGSVPVAALTGYLSSEDRERATRVGFQAYLVKPVDPAELIRTVRTLALDRRSALEASTPDTSTLDTAALESSTLETAAHPVRP